MEGKIYNIVNLNSSEKKIFSEEEAINLASLLTYLADSIKKQIKQIELQIQSNKHDLQFVEKKQSLIGDLVNKWSEKVKRLGATPVSISQVKIPTAHGHFYWEHVEIKH